MADNIEKVYSKALFDAVKETGEDTAEAMRQLESATKIAEETEGLYKLMDSPIVTDSEKLSVIDEAFKGRLTPCVLNFLKVLTEEKRWHYLKGICACFIDLCAEDLGFARITVTTAFPLTDKQRDAVKEKMSKVIGKKIEISEKTDRSIVGGMIVDYGDSRMDGSVKTRLEGLKESFDQLIS